MAFFSDDESYTIDIVKDVINPVCTQWVCQTLVRKYHLSFIILLSSTCPLQCDYKLRCDKPDSGQAEDTRHMSEQEMHEAFVALYT